MLSPELTLGTPKPDPGPAGDESPGGKGHNTFQHRRGYSITWVLAPYAKAGGDGQNGTHSQLRGRKMRLMANDMEMRLQLVHHGPTEQKTTPRVLRGW